jgi:hypothetical protein
MISDDIIPFALRIYFSQIEDNISPLRGQLGNIDTRWCQQDSNIKKQVLLDGISILQSQTSKDPLFIFITPYEIRYSYSCSCLYTADVAASLVFHFLIMFAEAATGPFSE